MILNPLKDLKFTICKITLTCNREELIKRISKDVNKGIRDKSSIQKSLDYLDLYNNFNTIKIDTSKKNLKEITDEIINIIK